jgi:hypothetical protein
VAALEIATLCTIVVNVVTEVTSEGVPATVRLSASKKNCPVTRVVFNPTLRPAGKGSFAYRPPYVCWIPKDGPPVIRPGSNVTPLPKPDVVYPEPL